VTPDFDELVGTDLDPEERARLARVHDLLVAAGPPPAEPAAPNVVHVRPRRRRGALLAVAAALAVSAVALGGALVHGPGDGVEHVAMEGTAAARDASASLTVFEIDDAGNWPMELKVDGLMPSAGGRPFELWLTRAGELKALCGAFLTDESGKATVPMNAPYRFSDFDGWVVVEEGSTTPLLTT
jgi:hypothetical protein